MAKHKHKSGIPCGCTAVPYVMPEDEQKSRFKKDYEFNKGKSVRSPVTGWEYNHIVDSSDNSYTPKKEVSLVKGTPHRFKAVRTGNIYASRKAIVRSK